MYVEGTWSASTNVFSAPNTFGTAVYPSYNVRNAGMTSTMDFAGGTTSAISPYVTYENPIEVYLQQGPVVAWIGDSKAAGTPTSGDYLQAGGNGGAWIFPMAPVLTTSYAGSATTVGTSLIDPGNQPCTYLHRTLGYSCSVFGAPGATSDTTAEQCTAGGAGDEARHPGRERNDQRPVQQCDGIDLAEQRPEHVHAGGCGGCGKGGVHGRGACDRCNGCAVGCGGKRECVTEELLPGADELRVGGGCSHDRAWAVSGNGAGRQPAQHSAGLRGATPDFRCTGTMRVRNRWARRWRMRSSRRVCWEAPVAVAASRPERGCAPWFR